MKVPGHAIPIVSSAIPDPAAETPSTFSSTVERREASADPKPVTFGAPPIQVNAKILATPTKHAFTKCGVINERLLPIVIDNEFPPAEAELLKNQTGPLLQQQILILPPSPLHPPELSVIFPNELISKWLTGPMLARKDANFFFLYFPSVFLLEYAFYFRHA